MKAIKLCASVFKLYLLLMIGYYIFNRHLDIRAWIEPLQIDDGGKIFPRTIPNHTFAQKKVYNITWYNPPDFLWSAKYVSFQTCDYTNCQMKFDPKFANQSEVVIFNGHAVKPNDYFTKKHGQVWIYASIESPSYLWEHGSHWTRGDWVSSFNWTMTYDKSNTDIHLPFGKIRMKQRKIKFKNYTKIFRTKDKMALVVHSHCQTASNRETFLNQLGKYIDIESLGKCGKTWKCGRLYRHDNCFQIINRYKFYLAFENSLCDQYFTEKIFRNFNYDSLMVIRGGRKNDTQNIFPSGTFISTADFKNVKELAKFLNKLANSEEMYTDFLKRKDQFYSIPYEDVYEGAMCQVCERMNRQDVYEKQIRNITKWAYGRKSCERAHDLEKGIK